MNDRATWFLIWPGVIATAVTLLRMFGVLG